MTDHDSSAPRQQTHVVCKVLTRYHFTDNIHAVVSSGLLHHNNDTGMTQASSHSYLRCATSITHPFAMVNPFTKCLTFQKYLGPVFTAS